MYLVLSVILPVLFAGKCSSHDKQDHLSDLIISVDNGQKWGLWGPPEMCPQGTYATGFQLKVEAALGKGDDTALNGIALQCTNSSKPKPVMISSTAGSWGYWGKKFSCPDGVLKAFSLRVEADQVLGDNTAVNNIRFLCTGNQELVGNGRSWGTWGSWSKACPGKGICGIQTKVQEYQGSHDDTALNDVHFYCCK
ncbi:vitelline membrane outer layer protein 1 homolog [Trichomycterus rosablanca]|uniref:vitelline membrane outer layer protein 1 homolog n=1 Tax=Trichomycterus rosablanca TaxID=2290929 RepID=UPI002F35C78E